LRQHEDLRLRVVLADLERGLEAAQPRHRDVHQDDIRTQGAGELDGLLAVGRLADHGDVLRERQERADAVAQDGVVIRDQDPNAAHASPPG
jgi:hypothetical protein